MEDKLDEDFIFYLGFTNTFLRPILDEDLKGKCEQWLQKLCGQPISGVHKKRCRNLYLTQLLNCMQNAKLSEPFLLPPNDVDISNAFDVFLPPPVDIEKPSWLEESNLPQDDLDDHPKIKGSTYLATRTLPDGQGAFAYIAISLSDEEPKWLGAGEGVLDKHFEQKYKEEIPNYEMEQILARRKDPKEREKVLTFYDVLLQNIADELDGKVHFEHNKVVSDLIEELVNDLKERREYEPFVEMDEKTRRAELLLILHDRVKSRRDKVLKREEVLDNLEDKFVAKSFFETSVLPEDKFQFPAAMWEQIISKVPNRKFMEQLQGIYPLTLINKYLEFLADEKEEVAVRMQKRHENILSQMKKELRKENDKGKKIRDDVKHICDQVLLVRKAVKDAFDKKAEAERRNEELFDVPLTEHSKLYEQMRAALFDTQKSVEEEAARGKFLAAQINVVADHSELSKNINAESIRKAEEANMGIIKNIKRLNAAIKQHQDRIGLMQRTSKGTGGITFLL